MSDRTWRRQIAWCWTVVPQPPVVTGFHPVIIMDGIRVGAYVCLIARTPSYVLTWRWVGWESGVTWTSLLETLPAPAVVVCDGQKGMLGAIARCWPGTKIQRCTWHVWQNIRAKLTLHPQTRAGQELLALTNALWQVRDLDDARRWERGLADWCTTHGAFIRQKTWYEAPLSGHRRWWYTHREVRSAARQLEKLAQNGQLFTYLEPNLSPHPIPRTTNHVEGGVNSPIRTQLKYHRGLPQLHRQRLVEWYLTSRLQDQKPPRNGR